MQSREPRQSLLKPHHPRRLSLNGYLTLLLIVFVVAFSGSALGWFWASSTSRHNSSYSDVSDQGKLIIEFPVSKPEENASLQMIRKSHLPDDQKRRIIVQRERVSSEFKNGNLKLVEVGELAQLIDCTPVMGELYYVENNLLIKSGLSASEKKNGSMVIHQLMRGVCEEIIRPIEIEAVISSLIPKTSLDLNNRLQPSGEVVRSMVARLQVLVESNKNLDTSFDVDFSRYIEQRVDYFMKIDSGKL